MAPKKQNLDFLPLVISSFFHSSSLFYSPTEIQILFRVSYWIVPVVLPASKVFTFNTEENSMIYIYSSSLQFKNQSLFIVHLCWTQKQAVYAIDHLQFATVEQCGNNHLFKFKAQTKWICNAYLIWLKRHYRLFPTGLIWIKYQVLSIIHKYGMYQCLC